MAHELVSPHCSSWSFSSFSGGTRTKFDAASTVTANEDRASNSDYDEAVFSPLPTVDELGTNHQYRHSLALLVNYFAAGLFHGVVPALVYPLFKIRLGLQSYQSNAAQTLLGCAWHGKIFLCLLTDCVPIGGRKRTPYLYVGWILVLVIFGLMLLDSVDDVNDAPRLILVISTASTGVLLVDAACDGLMVETVHHDSLIQEKGLLRAASLSQGAVHSVRFIAELLGTLIVAIGMNSEQYKGAFSFELSIRGLLMILIVGAFMALGATWWGLYEPSTAGGDTEATSAVVVQRLREFWCIMTQRATWQIAIFGFLQKLSLSFGMDSAPPSQAIHEFWLHTDPFSKNVFLALVNSGVCIAASIFVHRNLLSTGWHSSVLLTLLGGLVTGFSVTMIVVFNMWRNKFLFLIAAEIVGFTDCIAMVMRMLVVVEIAEPGFESSTYGLVTSVYNLADPIATALSNAIGGFFCVFDADIEQDSKDVRMRAGALVAVLFSVRALVGLGALPLLPKQRHDARELKARGGSSKLSVFAAIAVAFIATLGINFLSVFPNTACLRIAGGMGC
ncbi:hypothetical protein DVH05_026887 [Phytophthora capsici]|nr:hypothetical protein DVH05_026887 [Phytophthora capsici]